jgi:hypothetical protein
MSLDVKGATNDLALLLGEIGISTGGPLIISGNERFRKINGPRASFLITSSLTVAT